DLALVAGPGAVDIALPERGDLALLHARPDGVTDVLHRERGKLVREPHALDLLLGLDRPRVCQEGRRVHDLRAEGVKERVRIGRRLTDHPVGGLRAERELEADLLEAALRDDLLGELGGARRRRTRIALVVAAEEADVARPRGALGVLALRLEGDQRRLAL